MKNSLRSALALVLFPALAIADSTSVDDGAKEDRGATATESRLQGAPTR